MKKNKLKNKIYIFGVLFFVILFLFGGFLGTSYFANIGESPAFTVSDVSDIKMNGFASKEIFFKFYTNILTRPSMAVSNTGLKVAQIFGYLLSPIIWVLGKILLLIIFLLVKIASFNTFINSTAVTEGWVIVRDLCNMFFIAILLVIAFATILHRESYNVKQLLPKLILMAILINFSKMICGLIIDVAQVAMLTFVNGFKELAGGNMVEMLGIDKILSLQSTDLSETTASANKLTITSIVGSMILALLYLIIAIVVVGTMVMVLVYRMVMLWVYIVLSPVAYILAAFPQGKSYSSQWWTEFSKQVIIGPVLAFFIWLSFISATRSGGDFGIADVDGGAGVSATGAKIAPTAGATEAGTWDHALKFIISIAMLIGGLIVSQQIGGAAGGAAGKGMALLQKGKGFGKKTAFGAAKGVTVGTAKFAGRSTLKGLGTLSGKDGGLGAVGDMAKTWHGDIIDGRKKKREEKWEARAKRMGMDNDTIGAAGAVADSNLGKNIKNAGKIVTTIAYGGAMALAGSPFLPAAMVGASGVIASIPSAVKNSKKNKKDKEKKELDGYKDKKDANKKEAQDEKKTKLDELNTKHQKKRDLIENSVILSEQQKTQEISGAEQELKKGQESVNKNYEDKISEIDKKYNSNIEHIDNEKERIGKLDKVNSNNELTESQKTEERGKINKEHDDYYKYSSSTEHAIDKATNSTTNQNWHPNGAIMGAAKKAQKDSDDAKKIVNTIASGKGVHEYGGWYSAHGQTGREKAKFEQLAKGDKKAEAVLDKINKTLLKIKADGVDNMGDKEKDNLKNLFEGLAAFKKGGGDISGKLNATIQIANDIKVHGDSKNEAKTIEELQEQIIDKA